MVIVDEIHIQHKLKSLYDYLNILRNVSEINAYKVWPTFTTQLQSEDLPVDPLLFPQEELQHRVATEPFRSSATKTLHSYPLIGTKFFLAW
jgi:hypothetical protein